VPPPPKDGLGQIRKLLDSENAFAFRHARAWAAQLILEQRSTQILVVADSPAQDGVVNQRLETELQRLAAHYSVTDPIAIRDPAATPSPATRTD
jgi:hypothetical protein